LFFIATDTLHGRELWKSDGTEVGTVLVKDINPGKLSSGARLLACADGILYLIASDGMHGSELWKSDGTEAGTVLVKDINPGTANSNPGITPGGDGNGTISAAVLNGILYFAATMAPMAKSCGDPMVPSKARIC
jgi:ELWxxDGT repeat protein